ncbi:MAG TPA: RecQ family ATP-dependent DNA helicase [Isosphaeraceae bacterium]|jgi:ATP-dependent DNA helicase RecQ|nr:RecQ family ATP-dependent DNA helicase [Isosphaeraceae bacterium]
MSRAGTAEDLEQTLHERFGLERFRPGQREVIEHVLQGRDVLCVMPTGGGKSLCYQLPALLLDGLTLVVSPLIALMKDQVDVLRQRGIRATLINSTLDPAEQHARIVEIEAGRYDLVYVAPERFRSGRFVEAMAKIRPALLAVDEAHCISEWGHDFRPDYARIGHARRQLGSPTCIALTATATDLVRRDIADQLDLREPAQFVTGFDRPNLVYRVIEARKENEKLVSLQQVLDDNPGSAIVYASSRARCEMIGTFVEKELRRSAAIYHAGMTREDRTSAQERFMGGQADVVVATNAFGMGVDKADIRSVIHFNMPGTLEAYYQEAGRSGRDGHPAECVLLFAYSDRFLQEMFIENEYPPADVVYRSYDFLRAQDADPIELTQAEIKEAARIDLAEQAVGSALRILEGAGAIERFRPRENMAIVRINAEPEEPSLVPRLSPQANVQRIVLTGLEGLVNRRLGEPVYFHPDDFAATLGLDRTALGRALRHLAAELPIDYVPPFRGNAIRVIDRERRPRDLQIDFSALSKRKEQEYEKLERMIRYAQTAHCRRSYILGYFGDHSITRCGRCDNCGPTLEPLAEPPGPPMDSPAGREVLLKVLSGVARAKGRFGKLTVAQMLTGSTSEKMAKWGLASLSTFGILPEFKQPEVVQILDALGVAGLVGVEDVDRFRPIVTLTPEGWSVLRAKGEQGIAVSLPLDLTLKVRNGGLLSLAAGSNEMPVSSSISEPPANPAFDFDGAEQTVTAAISTLSAGEPLRDRLKAMRTDWACEARQPSYCVFSNETLDLLVRERPQTAHDLARIKGMGPARLERYGAALLSAIQEAPPARAPERVETRSAAVQADPWIAGEVPTEEWTWRLLDRGFSAVEAAAIRGLELATIIRHATSLVGHGRPVPLGAFLTPEQAAIWDAWYGQQGEASPPADLGSSPAFWPLYLALRQSS